MPSQELLSPRVDQTSPANSAPGKEDPLARCREFLRGQDLSVVDVESLLEYNNNVFRHPVGPFVLPLPDEPFTATWAEFAHRTATGTIRALEPFLPQLRFPIRTGMSDTLDYYEVVRLGRFSTDDTNWQGLELAQPNACTVSLAPTPAGAVPVITTGERTDFVRLAQAFGYKNEPHPIPSSMGAMMISGYKNWYRVQQIRLLYGESEARDLLQCKSSYQDRFVLLSKGPYSGVNACDMQLTSEAWEAASVVIRREHEAAHYFTRRLLASMRNNIFDEILADYCGLVSAFGRFEAHRLLVFMGLEHYPEYRAGARLENYCGTPPLTAAAFRGLQSLVVSAASMIEAFDSAIRSNPVSDPKADWSRPLLALSFFRLEELATKEFFSHLLETYARVCRQVSFA